MGWRAYRQRNMVSEKFQIEQFPRALVSADLQQCKNKGVGELSSQAIT